MPSYLLESWNTASSAPMLRTPPDTALETAPFHPVEGVAAFPGHSVCMLQANVVMNYVAELSADISCYSDD